MPRVFLSLQKGKQIMIKFLTRVGLIGADFPFQLRHCTGRSSGALAPYQPTIR